MIEKNAPSDSEAEIESDAADSDDAAPDVEHLTFQLHKNLTRRIDQYLTDRIPYLSRNGVQKLIDEGLVKVNGRIVKASYRPRDGDTIEMVAPPEPVTELVPEPIPLDVIYEDDHFLALNKQADLMVHPARGVWTGTLVNGLVHYGQRWSSINGNWRPGILHRLDRNTTGVMLVAKSDEAHWRMARQFEDRTIQKTYLAIIHGAPQLLSDVIDMPIGKDRYVRERQAVRKVENGGKPAVTKYEVQEIFGGEARSEKREAGTAAGIRLIESDHPNDRKLPSPPAGKFSFIKLSPKTGRTHQLRVHMSALGVPMVGDTMYGGRIFEAGGVGGGGFRFARQALHAYEITFTHPGTREKMTLAAPLPPDMSRLLEILRADRV
ncbi:MAG TPA: RluA family pseudouridine synthase [Tepidisphaeraceae bacterium]